MARARTAGACACGNHVGPGGLAVAVDPAVREANLKRLRRIEGQVRGIQKMVEEGRWCADVLTQVGAVQEALRAVARELLRNHVRHCATAAIRAGGDQADAVVDELVEVVEEVVVVMNTVVVVEVVVVGRAFSTR